MKYLDEKTDGILSPSARLLAVETPDYSEEAIPERDPAFRLPAGTDHEEPTVADLSEEERRSLARVLEELGMSRARAAAVACL
jgi:hypothetical protein